MKSNFLFAKYSLVLMAFVFIFISCSKDKEEAVPEKITKIEFIENEVQLLIGKSDTLHLAHYSQKLPKPKYKLTSSNPDVVSVNDLGIIKALKEGKSEITATLAEENLKARVIVNVLPIVPEKLKLELPNTNVFVGDSVIVKYSIDPPNTTNITSYSIDWTSSDPTIFTVKDAKIKGLKAGKAKLTANIRGTNVSSEIEINVKDVLAKIIELNSATGEVKVGEIFKLIATVKPENTTNKELVWESSNKAIATVVDGEVKGLKEGEVVITVKTKDGSASATAKIKVVTIKVSKITLNETQGTITVGNTFKLIAKVDPENAHNKALTWSSSNTTIATVDQNGNVIGKKEGEVIITVKSNDGSASASAKIKIVTIKVSKITLNETQGSISVGNTFKLIAKVAPEDAHNKALTWSSSNTTIATVDQNGNVIGKKEGEVIITVKSNDGNVSASAKIKVFTIKVSKITLSETQGSMEVGHTYSLFADVGPVEAHNKGVVWSSNNTTIATVDQNGTVFAKKEGTVVITVKSAENPNIHATCTLKITPARVVMVYLSVRYREMNIGDKFTPNASVEPSIAQNKTIIWSSSNPQIATVDQNGTITAKSPGSVEIIATSQDNPMIKNSCTIFVKNLDSDVKVLITSSSSTSFNGFVSAVISHYIENRGSKKVVVKKMEIVDGFGVVKSVDTQQAELMMQDRLRYTTEFSRIYKPQIHYYFEIDGKPFKRILGLD
ncbi:Ig-like domain-containing protein [Sphingobacterium cellulitidis]|uniref:Ig-like domain-containing protein n=1 Tax=Sphingobacterium cellulitidis TaxID=1768011 RepID=UPI000B941DF5|nr:Ig-like domain-containing protein [Sphingobacterium cellulitidis]OYD44563.1 hypothetical protein CHU00_16425 [Sphingobacterium cellulitidis]